METIKRRTGAAYGCLVDGQSLYMYTPALSVIQKAPL